MSAFTETPLTWDEFLAETLPEARTLVPDNSEAGVALYLAALAAGACRVTPGTVPVPAAFSAYPGFPPEVGFALSYRGDPFIGVQFHIEPGAFLPFHPHPGGCVCTLFLEGSARVRTLEFVGAPDWEKKGDVLVRQTREELLLPGRISLIGNPHDNIHGFIAGPDGARGIDLTTLNLPEERRPDSLLELEKEPYDPDLLLYEAVWRDR